LTKWIRETRLRRQLLKWCVVLERSRTKWI